MIFSFIKNTVYLILGIFTIFFLIGNISLMKSSHEKNITTNQKIDLKQHRVKPVPIETTEATNDLKQYGEHLKKQNDIECGTTKQQILRNIRFKQDKDKVETKGTEKGLDPLDKLSPIDLSHRSAPELENFEDYAPVDTPMHAKPPLDQGHIKFKPDQGKQDPDPLGVNAMDVFQQSKFLSQYRVPWSGEKGKDDLSYFFEVKVKENEDENEKKKNESVPRRPVACTDEWGSFIPV